MPETNQATEMDSLKQRLKSTWSAGDFGQIAKSYQRGAASFISELGIKPGQKILDVACGNGNLSFPAAQAGAVVTGVDIAPNLILQAKQRAENEGLNITFEEGDAERLPYSDASFEIAVSMFGAMFAPRPELVVSELLRVTASGGTLAMANWTKESFIGEMFKTIAGFVPPPAIMPSPLLWGDEAIIRERFKEAKNIATERQSITFEFDMPPEEVVSFWREYYGPTQRAFAALDGDSAKQEDLYKALSDLWKRANRASGNTTTVDSQYLKVLVSR